MRLDRTETTLQYIRSKREIRVQDILDVLYDLCEDVKSDTGKALEAQPLGEDETAVGRLCWLAMTVARIQRNNEEILSQAEFKRRWERAKGKFAAAEEVLRDAEAALEENKKKIKEKEQELDAKEESLKQKKEGLKEAAAELIRREKDLNTAERNLEAEEKRLQKKEKELAEKEAGQKRWQQELEAKEKELDRTITLMPQKPRLIFLIEESIAKKEAQVKELTKLTENLKIRNGELESVKTECRNIQTDTDEVKRQIPIRKAEYEKLQQTSLPYFQEAKKIQEQIDSFEKMKTQLPSVEILKEREEAAQKAYLQAKRMYETELARIEKSCEEFKKKTEQECRKYETELTRLKNQIKMLENQKKALEDQIKVQGDQIKDKTAEVDRLEDQKKEKQTELNGLTGSVKTAEDELERLKKAICTAQDTLRGMFEMMKEQEEERKRLISLADETKTGIAETQKMLEGLAREQTERLEPLRRQANLFGHLWGNLTADQVLGNGWMIDKEHYLQLKKNMNEQIELIKKAVNECQVKYKSILNELEKGRI